MYYEYDKDFFMGYVNDFSYHIQNRKNIIQYYKENLPWTRKGSCIQFILLYHSCKNGTSPLSLYIGFVVWNLCVSLSTLKKNTTNNTFPSSLRSDVNEPHFLDMYFLIRKRARVVPPKIPPRVKYDGILTTFHWTIGSQERFILVVLV